MALVQNCTGTETQGQSSHDEPADETDEIEYGDKQRHHQHHGDDAGCDSLRIGSVPRARIASTCSVTTIEPSFGSDAGCVASGDESAGDGRAKFAHQRERNGIAGQRRSPKRSNCDAVCSTNTPPMKSAAAIDDGERADANHIHLLERVGPV